jgi:hypothetical protein
MDEILHDTLVSWYLLRFFPMDRDSAIREVEK